MYNYSGQLQLKKKLTKSIRYNKHLAPPLPFTSGILGKFLNLTKSVAFLIFYHSVDNNLLHKVVICIK